MTSVLELEGPPDNKAIRIDAVQLVELDLSKEEVEYHTPSGKIIIKYDSEAEALQAYNNMLDLINNPGSTVGINTTDTVLVSHNTHAKGALGEQYEAIVLAVPQPEFPYWIVQTESAVMVCEDVTVSKLTP